MESKNINEVTPTDIVMENIAILDKLERDGWSDTVITRVERAVNAHEELVATLKDVKEWLNSKAVIARDDYKRSGFAHWVIKLDEAIAKAEGK